MGLLVTSRKFFYQNKNNTDFATATGDSTNFLRTSVGELCKAVYEFTLTNFISVDPTAGNSFVITNISGDNYALDILNGGDWTNFKEGFVFDVFDNDTAALKVIDGTVGAIIGNTLFFTSTTVTTGTYVDADAKTTQEWTDFNFFYRHFGNDFLSPIDGSPQQYHADLGSPQSTSLVTGDALGSGAWQNGSFKTKFVSDSDGGAIQLFTFEHIFEVLPYFESGQIADITNVNTVVPYVDGIINYDFRLEAYNIANVTSTFVNEITQVGQVTWYNSAKSNLPTSYSLTSITYTDTVTSKILTKLTTENKVHVVAVIADNGTAPFITLDPFTVKHSLLLEDFADNTTQLFDEIWLNENKRNTLDSVANSGTIITDLTGVRNSAVQITIEFDVELTAPQKLQVENGFNYLLLIYLEDSTKTNLNTNETPLILDVNNYTVNTDIDGIISETSSLFYKHVNNIGSDGTTDYDGTIEDGVVGVIGFTIAPSTKEVILNNLAFIIVAYDTVNNVWFEIQRNDIGIAQNIFITDSGTGKKLQQIELNTTRGFSLKAGNQFNFKKIVTGLFVNPSQPYTLTFGFKINWEAFEPLLKASTDFYDASLENNGLNLRTSNYSGKLNRQIRFGREYIYTVNGIKTTKVIFSPDSDINDYGESDDNWSVIIKTENDAAFDLEKKFLNREDTTIVALFTDGNTQTNIDEFDAVIIAKEKNSSDFFEISTKREVLAGGVLKPITGLTASKAIVGGDIEVRCKMDFEKLANLNYNISARIFTSPLFINAKSLLFDGVDEWVDFGNDSSLDFERTDSFSVGCMLKFDVGGVGTDFILSRMLEAEPFRGWELFKSALTGNQLSFVFRSSNTSPSEQINIRADDVFGLGSWRHIMVTYNGNNMASGFKMYIDAVSSSITVLDDTMGTNTTKTNAKFNIGRRNNIATNFMKGNIDRIGIWNRELSPSEVTDEYNGRCVGAGVTTGLISRYNIDDSTIPTIVDSVGPNTGTTFEMEAADIVADVDTC